MKRFLKEERMAPAPDFGKVNYVDWRIVIQTDKIIHGYVHDTFEIYGTTHEDVVPVIGGPYLFSFNSFNVGSKYVFKRYVDCIPELLKPEFIDLGSVSNDSAQIISLSGENISDLQNSSFYTNPLIQSEINAYQKRSLGILAPQWLRIILFALGILLILFIFKVVFTFIISRIKI